MKKPILLFLIILAAAQSFACSTFLINKNGHLVFGRNYDWSTGNGIVLINPSGLTKSSMVYEEKNITWTSKYGSLTFNQFGKEFPYGGMNEKGLVIDLMALDGTVYEADDDRPAINQVQWIQYQLDNSATVAEVLASEKLLRISRKSPSTNHFLIADATGDAATIEFINGKMIVHRGKQLPVPVLTNNTYQSAQNNFKSAKDILATKSNSQLRFNKACSMVSKYQQDVNSKTSPVDEAFKIMNEISQGDYTVWSIAYDITNRRIEFFTKDNKKRRSISFADLNFNCSNKSNYISIDEGEGNLAGKFRPLTMEHNRAVIKISAEGSKKQIDLPQEVIDALSTYFATVYCKPE
ncbi:linear amide C-N hydrolase [Pseudoflavitalea sp. G-6-1-2]|uniref:linear amide C-N hydrolase n=1 Tax=Pseudoflavitalea sp. G-6-1-2 TaxID=2728841 RepID=UPI00146B4C49|nr:linear amide C-N hydrolase [Pseudoflavitalea sp. G-6-1-2]NML20724.1 linear amide C-N hydrolase [Pseudoflavitalea sp. G-6-1-2]